MNDAADEWISGTATLNLGGAEIEMELTVPANPVAPRRMLPLFQRMSDSFIGLSLENVDESVSCRAGCGACCRQLVPVSQTEAHHLSELVAQMPPARQTEIRSRFAAALTALENANLLDRLREPEEYSEEDFVETGMRYFALGVACPFLENESCSIHPDRPLVCREYLVTSPAANCDAPTPENIRRVPLIAKISTALCRLNERRDGSPFFPFVPLVLALEFAAEELPPDTGQNILRRIFENLTDVNQHPPSD